MFFGRLLCAGPLPLAPSVQLPGGAAGSLSLLVQMPTLQRKDRKLIQTARRPGNQTPEPSPETPH